VDAVKLFEKYTVEELVKMNKVLVEDPVSISDEYKAGRTIWIYTKKVQKKLDAIGWAIFYHQQAKRKETDGQDNESTI